MQIVIDIPEHIYRTLVETGKYGYYKFDAKKAIKNGTPLPKGMSVLLKDIKMPNSCINCPILGKDKMYCVIFPRRVLNLMEVLEKRADWCPLVEIPTVLEADKEDNKSVSN